MRQNLERELLPGDGQHGAVLEGAQRCGIAEEPGGEVNSDSGEHIPTRSTSGRSDRDKSRSAAAITKIVSRRLSAMSQASK